MESNNVQSDRLIHNKAHVFVRGNVLVPDKLTYFIVTTVGDVYKLTDNSHNAECFEKLEVTPSDVKLVLVCDEMPIGYGNAYSIIDAFHSWRLSSRNPENS